MNSLAKVTKFNSNKRFLLKESGFKSITQAKREFDFDGTNDELYKILMENYNGIVEQVTRNDMIRRNSDYFEKKTTKRQEYIRNEKLKTISERIASRKIGGKIVKMKASNNAIKSQVYELPRSVEGEYLLENLRTAFKEFKGENVVAIYIIGNEQKINVKYEIPNIGFSSWWNKNSKDWWVDSEMTVFVKNNHRGKVIIYKENVNIPQDRIIQAFRDGITHCVFTPIRKWATANYEDAKSKQSKSRYNVILRDITKLEDKYKSGVPEDAIAEICNELQVDIHIDLPFCENKFIVGESVKKRLKLFKFTNTRMNHIELNEIVSNDEGEKVSFEELNKIKEKLDENNEYYTFNKNNKKISSISTLSKTYGTSNNYSDVVNEWLQLLREDGIDLNSCKIDDMDDYDLSQFVGEGTHYNATIDFVKDIHEMEKDDIKHIDMKKAYTNSNKCKFYEGFLGKITDYRQTDKIEGVGMYRITDIVFPEGKLKKLNEQMKMYINNNVYPSVELKMLQENGITFKIVSGCWGVKSIDFEFNDAMIETKDEDGVSYYAKWTGAIDSHKLTKSFWLKGEMEFFNVIKNECGNGVVRWFENGEGCIEFPKKHNLHLGHITAFITAYQRLNAIEQLLEFDYENLIRICVDGIYHIQDEVKLCNVFRDKNDKMRFGNDAGSSYVSNVYDKPLFMNEPQAREHFNKELHLGEGGSGKTHFNLIDKGFQRVLYLAPSWKLARNKEQELGKGCSVWARALTQDTDRIKYIREKANVLVIDEVSMLNEGQKQEFFSLYGDMKIIMCGDLGFQLPCITGEPMNKSGFDNIAHHRNDYRSKDEELRDIKRHLRVMIEKKHTKETINKWVIEVFSKLNRVIGVEKLKELYSVEDMILSGTNEIKNYYTDIFKGKFETEKYYIKDNNRLYSNGDIVISSSPPEKCSNEIRHCFTTHSIQGETAQFKLFIDNSKMFDMRMFYTAISRAQRLDQIFIIENAEMKFKYEFGKIYKIESKSGVYIGSTIAFERTSKQFQTMARRQG
jgi:hypothetical protein